MAHAESAGRGAHRPPHSLRSQLGRSSRGHPEAEVLLGSLCRGPTDTRLASKVRLYTARKAVEHPHLPETDLFFVRVKALEASAVLVSLLWGVQIT